MTKSAFSAFLHFFDVNRRVQQVWEISGPVSYIMEFRDKLNRRSHGQPIVSGNFDASLLSVSEKVVSRKSITGKNSRNLNYRVHIHKCRGLCARLQVN